MNISIGQLVTSNAGRDQASIYLVVGIKNQYLLLVNGRERKIKNPKQKNIRHVNVLKSIAQGVAEKLQSGMKITDEEIRQAIKVLYKPDNL
ncbi:50S ribosomal protein L14 [Pelosinus sp. sgz500959]|uniref:50S ribosomal protein L14 n=1 Tax=Pelosinus sp. sgz500959 TaxID=3242472 RepID=UPI00367062C2